MSMIRAKILAIIFSILTICSAQYTYGDPIAATLQVTYDGSNVRSLDYKAKVTGKTQSASAVEFKIDITAPALGMTAYESYGYCIELAEHISSGKYLFALNELSDENFYKAAWVMENYAPARPDMWTETLRIEAAAVQGLIWELTGNIHSVVTHKKDETKKAIYKEYQAIKTSLDAVNWSGEEGDALISSLGNSYMIARLEGTQDLLVKVDPVPEPATLLLFGSGMLGLAGLRVRRKAKAN